MVGIYKITNPKGKIYIGQSTNLKKRFRGYRNLECKGQMKLYNSFKKYGPENHKFEIIEECIIGELNEKEIYWIKYFGSIEDGLNLREGGKNGRLSEETKLKISRSLKGRKNVWYKMGCKDYKYTEEQKQKMRKPRVNKWEREKMVPPNIVEEIRTKFNSGYKRSELSREYNISWGTVKNITDRINSYKDI